MTMSSRVLLSVTLVGLGAWSQGNPKRPGEQEEWNEAYHLARVARPDRPTDGFVPTAEIAIRVGEVVASALYGETTATRERPFRARLRGDVWTIMGTPNPPGAYGGVAIIQISKNDGRILFAHHTQ